MSKEIVKFISNGSFMAKGIYNIPESKAKTLEMKGYGEIEKPKVEKPKTTRKAK